MVGPRISFRIAGVAIAFGAIDLLLAALILTGVVRQRIEPTPGLWLAIPASLVVAAFGFLVNLLSERLRLRIARGGTPPLPTIVTLPVANGPTVAESKSTTMAARGGATGMGIDLAIGLIAVAIYMLFNDTERRIADLAVIAAIAIGGSAGIRFLAAPSLNGGRVVRWMLEYTFDDEENALRLTRLLGYLVATMLFIAGVLMLASEGEAGFWGIGLAAAGIDVGALSALATRQTIWLQTAGDRFIGNLLERPHALVSAASPLDEMVSVLSVDGPSAVAVVRDGAGNSVGIMQFQQMRAGVGLRTPGVTIGDVMIPIDALPAVAADVTLLEAAQVLLASSRPAVRFVNERGKTVIVTARDMGIPR